MFKRFLVFAFLISLLLPVGVQAQGNAVRLSFLQVDLWPEYDAPEMLVIMRAQLAADVPLPADLVFRIPAAVGQPNAVAVRQPDGALLNAMYEIQTDDQWVYVNITATAPEVQLEYYDPQLEKDGADRHYEYSWMSDYDVESMLVLVQQPVGARQMSVEPDLGEFQLGSDGLQYYIMEIGAPAAGDVVNVNIDYQKDSDTLSFESFQVQPSEPIADDSQGRSEFDLMSLLPWLLGGLGLLLVVGGIVWYWQSGREAPQPRKTSRSRKPGAGIAANSVDDTYCHQCGKRASGGDRFCRACGTRLRLH